MAPIAVAVAKRTFRIVRALCLWVLPWLMSSEKRCQELLKNGTSDLGLRWSRGSDPRLLRLTMDGYSTAHVGSDPAHQESSRPKVRSTRRFTGAMKFGA